MSSEQITPAPSERGKLSADDLITLNEEIAGMARAGLPLDQGLSALAREMRRGRLQSTTRKLADDLRAGLTLPQALERQRGSVPPYYAALLAAAVRSGRIGEVLGTLTIYARSIADFRSTIISALLYPAIILVLGLGLLAFTGAVILPAFHEVFEKMKLKLPLVTQALLWVGDHVMEVFVWPLLILLAVVLLARWGFRSNAGGRVLWARFVYALPLYGSLLRSARLAAFADLLGILVDQSIPLPEALRLAAEASSDPLLTAGAERVEKELGQGIPLAEALRQYGLVPELVIWMTGFGEKQGTLGTSLHHVAQMYRRQAEARAALLRTVLPPLLILLLGTLLAGVFIFGLLGPMYNLLDGLGGGKMG